MKATPACRFGTRRLPDSTNPPTLPGGKVDPGESFEEAAVRELAEETSLHAGAAGVRIVAVLMDGARGVTRVTAAAVLENATGTPRVTEPHKIVRWQWFGTGDVPKDLFVPSASVLRAWRPELELPDAPAHCYPTARRTGSAEGT